MGGRSETGFAKHRFAARFSRSDWQHEWYPFQRLRDNIRELSVEVDLTRALGWSIAVKNNKHTANSTLQLPGIWQKLYW